MRKKWNQYNKKGSFDEIEKALKGAIYLRVGGYETTIEEFEKNYSNKGRTYKHLSVNQQIELDNMYNKKINEIGQFTRSLCAVMLKQRYGDCLHSDSFIIQDLIKNKPNQLDSSALEEKNYFEAIGEELKDYERLWIYPLYNYYLQKIRNETPINFERLEKRVKKEILNKNTVDKWAYFFRGEELIDLANWVKEFVESVNETMIKETKLKIERFQNAMNPKFYLIKITEKGSAFVINEFGYPYLFIKGSKTPIIYDWQEYCHFSEIREVMPTAFPEFHPEEW